MSNTHNRIRSSPPRQSTSTGKSLLDDLAVVIVGNKVVPVSPVDGEEASAGHNDELAVVRSLDRDRVRPTTDPSITKRQDGTQVLGERPCARAGSDVD